MNQHDLQDSPTGTRTFPLHLPTLAGYFVADFQELVLLTYRTISSARISTEVVSADSNSCNWLETRHWHCPQ